MGKRTKWQGRKERVGGKWDGRERGEAGKVKGREGYVIEMVHIYGLGDMVKRQIKSNMQRGGRQQLYLFFLAPWRIKNTNMTNTK